MKIGVLTQPLHNNYGGLLQAYAMQTVLRRMGWDVCFLDIRRSADSPIKQLISYIKKEYLQKLYGGFKVYVPSRKEEKIISENTIYFRNKYLPYISEPLNSPQKLKEEAMNYQAFLVGSDQVWRPRYSQNIFNFFLDFTAGLSVKRIAYAASFGVEYWDFTPEQTRRCSDLAKNFDAISVREDSGVDLCLKHLGVEAQHLLDPTMLLSKEDYIEIVNQENESQSEGTLMTYILDSIPEKQNVIHTIASQNNLQEFSVNRKGNLNFSTAKHIHNCVFPTVTKWIRGFMDAEFVVTDSFHGTVFSILFNKPFLVFSNNRRGNARFLSILEKFCLLDRMIFDYDDFDYSIIDKHIDWNRVNRILYEERKKSKKFLHNYLN